MRSSLSNDMTFPASQLRAARKAAKLTQQEAADRTDGVVSARAWAEAEKGVNQPAWHRACAMWAAVGRQVIIAEVSI